jgi:hypothetical protein
MNRTLKVVVSVIAVAQLCCAIQQKNVVSFETVQSFRPARGSIAMGYSAAALNEATRLNEVRQKCGTPLAEWEDQVAFFNPKLKHLKYKAYDAHKNILDTTFTFVMTSSDPSLIGIEYGPPQN